MRCKFIYIAPQKVTEIHGKNLMPVSHLTGSRIREQRLMAGVRQADLAAQVGISASYLNLIEHNRRRIGGKLLGDLARLLDVDATSLSTGAETQLLATLRSAADGTDVELARTDEFAGRFPGWAALIAAQAERIERLERQVEAMSDRMTHDPLLARSLHDVISAVTSIRSTSSILVNGTDLDRDWQQRFHSNIHGDALRLAESSQSVVDYLEQAQDVNTGRLSAQEELEAYLEAQRFAFPELERGGAIDKQVNAAKLSVASGAQLKTYLQRYVDEARVLPSAQLVGQSNPATVVANSGQPFATVLRRMAVQMDAGLVTCDGSGALTLRKQINGFTMPRLGAPCALWPIYAALSRPMVPIRQVVELPGATAARFTCYAIAEPRFVGDFEAPQILEATMLIVSDGAADQPAQFVGTSCRICPRDRCLARREPSVLD
jgi:predicted transcriptional regulator/DNA-binding XRE family transcriptional regulator